MMDNYTLGQGSICAGDMCICYLKKDSMIAKNYYYIIKQYIAVFSSN